MIESLIENLDFVVNSVANNITGSINITNQGFIDITIGRLKIDGHINNITEADLEKLDGAEGSGMSPSKCVIYETHANIHVWVLVTYPSTNNNFVRLVTWSQRSPKTSYIPDNDNSNSDIVITTGNGTIGGIKTFSSLPICTGTPTNNNQLTTIQTLVISIVMGAIKRLVI